MQNFYNEYYILFILIIDINVPSQHQQKAAILCAIITYDTSPVIDPLNFKF